RDPCGVARCSARLDPAHAGGTAHVLYFREQSLGGECSRDHPRGHGRMKLPIDELLPRVIGELASGSNLVIEAPPGAGKTTRVPPALLPVVRGEILVLEPRRLAARMAARSVA